ncbi:MAG: histidine kinase N-terminal 7TM domain-containing protein, partial [Nitrospirales bacterium]
MPVPIFDPANYALSPYAGPPLVVALLLLALGLLVLIREGGSRTGMLFFVLSLTISVWLAASSVMYTAKDAGVALWWAKAAYLGTPFIPAAIYHFMVTVLRRASLRRRQVAAAWVASAAFCGLALLSDVLITGVQRFWWGYYPQYGWGSLPFLAFFFGSMIAAFRMLWIEYRDTPSATHKRRQAVFMAAIGIGYLASVDFLAKFGLPLYPLGYLPLLGFAVAVAFATDRYRMIDLTPAFAATQILNT